MRYRSDERNGSVSIATKGSSLNINANVYKCSWLKEAAQLKNPYGRWRPSMSKREGSRNVPMTIS
jgi:hypothetical protein